MADRLLLPPGALDAALHENASYSAIRVGAAESRPLEELQELRGMVLNVGELPPPNAFGRERCITGPFDRVVDPPYRILTPMPKQARSATRLWIRCENCGTQSLIDARHWDTCGNCNTALWVDG